MTTALEEVEESASRPGRSLPPVPIVQEAGWAPWPVWTGAENLTPTGIRSGLGKATYYVTAVPFNILSN